VRSLVLRWTVAVAVTIAAFAAATWVCGALVLAALKMHDAGVRWGVAGGLGVAVAALAALWGASFATGEARQPQPQPGQAPEGAPPATAGPAADGGEVEAVNEIGGGTFQQPLQGRDLGAVTTGRPQPASAPSGSGDDDAPASAPPAKSGSTRNTIHDGLFLGPVIQGRDFGTVNVSQPSGPAASSPPAGDQTDQE